MSKKRCHANTFLNKIRLRHQLVLDRALWAPPLQLGTAWRGRPFAQRLLRIHCLPGCRGAGPARQQAGEDQRHVEIALFEKGVDDVRSVGEFVQVFVDRETGRPSNGGMSATVRTGLERGAGDFADANSV